MKDSTVHDVVHTHQDNVNLKRNLEFYWCLQRTDLQICSSLGYEFWSKNKKRKLHLFCRWH
jgi:hypothetical protein